jgi:hypothetical protein
MPDGYDSTCERHLADCADSKKSLDGIRELCTCLSGDELRILHVVALRLWAGRSQYGKLHLQDDPRDWTQEAHLEAVDMSVYLAAALLRRSL